MKRKHHIVNLAGMLALGALAIGCASTGYQRADQTVGSLQATRAQVIEANRQVAGVMSTLNRLSQMPGGDLLPIYEQLAREATAIENQANAARLRADNYRDHADNYLDTWAQELSGIEDDAIRLRSAERQREVRAGFQALEREAAATRGAYAPFVTGLQGIVQYLGQDLTATGVTGMQPQIAQVRKNGAILRARIDQTVRHLDSITQSLAPRAR